MNGTAIVVSSWLAFILGFILGAIWNHSTRNRGR